MKSKLFIALVTAMMLTAVGSRAATEVACFPYAVALVESRTAIHEHHDLSSHEIGHGEAAERFAVQDRKLVNGDCWVQAPMESTQFRVGWLLDENLTTGCVRSIKGDAEFQAKIIAGLEYLNEEALRWFEYVSQYAYSIKPAEPDAGMSEAKWPSCTVLIDKSAFESKVVLATYLVHEACHIHQYVEQRLYRQPERYVNVRMEKECYGRELEMLREIAPEHKLIQTLEEDFRQPYWWWAKCRLHTPAIDIPPNEMERLTC